MSTNNTGGRSEHIPEQWESTHTPETLSDASKLEDQISAIT